MLVPFYYYKVGMGNPAFKGELQGEEVGEKKLLKQPETLNLCRIFPKASPTAQMKKWRRGREGLIYICQYFVS